MGIGRKTLDRYSGNFCFALKVPPAVAGDPPVHWVLVCNRYFEVISYATTDPLPILDLKTHKFHVHGMAFGNQYIGSFDGGIINSTWIDTGLTGVERFEIATDGNFYLLNRTDNQLVKHSGPGGSVTWTFDLPDDALASTGEILLRESDSVILYWNNSATVYAVHDTGSDAELLKSISIPGTGPLSVVVSGQQNPASAYVRHMQSSGTGLDQSSSTSSIDSSSTSTSTSTSSTSSEGTSSLSLTDGEGDIFIPPI